MNANHYTMRLNNYFQGRYGASAKKHCKFVVTSSGPLNCLTWEGTYWIDDIKYGVGHGPNKRAADEDAARKTIQQLAREGCIVP